jgi:hypothetical protein
MDEKTRKQIELATVPVRSEGMKPGEGPQGVYIGNGFVLAAAHCLKFDTYGGIALDHIAATVPVAIGRQLLATRRSGRQSWPATNAFG